MMLKKSDIAQQDVLAVHQFFDGNETICWSDAHAMCSNGKKTWVDRLAMFEQMRENESFSCDKKQKLEQNEINNNNNS